MLWQRIFSKVDYEESLSSFHQKLEKHSEIREFSQKVKDAVSRGIKQNQIKVKQPLCPTLINRRDYEVKGNCN